MRHPEPERIKLWRGRPPECCHTCDKYNNDGVCEQFDMEPPEDFASTYGACKHWIMEIPF